MSEFSDIIEQLFYEVSKIEPIEIADIPNIDLYMDQVTTFMENRLHCQKRFPGDKILTKTMINNYAKARLFPPPYKKKYTKNHIMLLIIIYHLKSILSINDINRLLKPITEELKINEKSDTLEIVYKEFVELQKKEISEIPAENTNIMAQIKQIPNQPVQKTKNRCNSFWQFCSCLCKPTQKNALQSVCWIPTFNLGKTIKFFVLC